MSSVRDLAELIDEVLPQTQCARCGYAGCRPYAEAIAEGAADIDRCPPGGDETVATLARMLGRAPVPLDISRGEPGPLRVARIDEASCIGCTLCISACPVDAIIGAPRRMHGVLTALCTGCELCVSPCPVDCIEMNPAHRLWTKGDADAARERHVARRERLAAGAARAAATAEARKRKLAVEAAIARARARRAALTRLK
jgi:H+/Na+-translocating ferredoxin:NAD+ oxidoreductase subunit B